ncbi:hypothetical protein [Desulfovibrio sp. QI0442]
MNDFKNATTECTEATMGDDYDTGNTPEEDLMIMRALTLGQVVDLGNGLYSIDPAVAAALLDGQKKRYFNG